MAQSIQLKSKVLVPTDALERDQAFLKSDDPNRVDVLFLTGQMGAAFYEYSWAQNEFYFAVDTAYSTKNFSSIPKIVRESNKYSSNQLRPLAALKVTQIQIIDAIVAKDTPRAKESVRKARTQINETLYDPRDKVNLLVDLTPYEQLLFDDEEMESCIKEITTLCSNPISSHPFFSRVVHRNAIPILTSDINDKTLQNLRSKLTQKKWKNMVDPTLKEVQNWKTKGNSSSASH